nr:hypothetical protein [Fusobacterium russii]
MRYKEPYTQKIQNDEISAFSSLNNIESSIYADILNSLVDISLLKSDLGEIPSISLLDEEEIPPYHRDKIWEQKGALDWNEFKHDNEFFYLGISSTDEIGSFLVELNKEDIGKSNIFYMNKKLPKEDILKNFEKYEADFKKIVPYTGEDERKKFKGE